MSPPVHQYPDCIVTKDVSRFDLSGTTLQDALDMWEGARQFNHDDPEETALWLKGLYALIMSCPDEVALCTNGTKRSEFYLDLLYFLEQAPDLHNGPHELPWLHTLQIAYLTREAPITAIDQDDLRALVHIGEALSAALDEQLSNKRAARTYSHGPKKSTVSSFSKSVGQDPQSSNGSNDKVGDTESATEDEESEGGSDIEDDNYEEATAKIKDVKHRTTETKSTSAKISARKASSRKASATKSYTQKSYTQKSRSIASDSAINYNLPRCLACIKKKKRCSRVDGSGRPCDRCAKSGSKCKSEKLKKRPNALYGRDKSLEKKRGKKF